MDALMKMASTSEERDEVDPSRKRYSIRTDRSSEFETTKDSSYELQIMQISSCWKGNSKYFPMGPTPATGSNRTRLGVQNKSTVISARFQLESFHVRKVRDKIDCGSNPMLDVQQPLYRLVFVAFRARPRFCLNLISNCYKHSSIFMFLFVAIRNTTSPLCFDLEIIATKV